MKASEIEIGKDYAVGRRRPERKWVLAVGHYAMHTYYGYDSLKAQYKQDGKPEPGPIYKGGGAKVVVVSKDKDATYDRGEIVHFNAVICPWEDHLKAELSRERKIREARDQLKHDGITHAGKLLQAEVIARRMGLVTVADAMKRAAECCFEFDRPWNKDLSTDTLADELLSLADRGQE